MSNSKDDNTNKDSSNKETTFSPPSLPELPDLKTASTTLRASISKGIKVAVQSTNAALANLQHTADVVRKPVNSGLETVEHASTEVATSARIAYERRHEFAPYYVLGSFVSVGGFFALRRGKIPGLLLGSIAGSLAYVALYEPMTETPTFRWPFPNVTRSIGSPDDSSNNGSDSGNGAEKKD